MAIHTHFIAAAVPGKPFHFEKLRSFIEELLREDIIRMPAAIFVGDAQNDLDMLPWQSKYASHFIVPNSPGSMLELGDKDDFPDDIYWYYGDDTESFFASLQTVPFGEKDCCICFYAFGQPWSDEYWEGAVVYTLVRPMPVQFQDYGRSIAFDRELDHYFVMYSSTGSQVEYTNVSYKPLIVPVMERYFGSDLIMAEVV